VKLQFGGELLKYIEVLLKDNPETSTLEAPKKCYD